MNIHFIFRIFILIGTSLIVIGCKPIQPQINKEEIKQSEPNTRITEYDQILMQFGKMYRKFYGNNEKIFIQSKPIKNATGSGGLPYDLSRMVISSVNKIGKPIYYVPYDPDYIINEVNTGGALSRNLPQFVIAGAITEYDKDLVKDGMDVDTDLSGITHDNDVDASVSRDRQNSLSRLGLDLHLLDYQDQTMIPGTQAINTIEIKNISKANSFSFFIFGSGLGLNGYASRKQGIHAALRLLVESSILQLLAREAGLPYWKITGGEEDQFVVDKVVDDLLPYNTQQHIKMIQKWLNRYGFEIEPTGTLDKITRLALKKLSIDYGFKYVNIDAVLAANIWLNQPYLGSKKYHNFMLLNSSSSKYNSKSEKLNLSNNTSLNYLEALQYISTRLNNKVGKSNTKLLSVIDKKRHVRTDSTEKIKEDLIVVLNHKHENKKFLDTNTRTLLKKDKSVFKDIRVTAYYETSNKKNELDIVVASHDKVIDNFNIEFKDNPFDEKLNDENSSTEELLKISGIDSEMKNDVIQVTTYKGDNDPIFYVGEKISFKLSVKKPLYVHFFNIDSSLNINHFYSSEEKLMPKKLYTIPSEEDGWEMIIVAPFGREVVKAFATDEYLDIDKILNNNVSQKKIDFINKLRQISKENNTYYYEKGVIFETRD